MTICGKFNMKVLIAVRGKKEKKNHIVKIRNIIFKYILPQILNFYMAIAINLVT